MFKKILIVYSEKLTNKHLETLEKVKNLVNGMNCLITKSHELNEVYFEGIDLVITIGGDGTFIRAATFLKDSLILGINSEPEYSEGALTSIKENELDLLKEILDGKFKIIQKERAKIKINGKEIDKVALNDVYIGTFSEFHVSRYVIKFKGKIEEHRSSGILIATGSGSNAWYKSAGGIPFAYDEKKLKFLIREPYFGRIFNPEILRGEILEGEKITIESRRREGGIIAIDSNLTYNFNFGDAVEVELSDTPLRVIQSKK